MPWVYWVAARCSLGDWALGGAAAQGCGDARGQGGGETQDEGPPALGCQAHLRRVDYVGRVSVSIVVASLAGGGPVQ